MERDKKPWEMWSASEFMVLANSLDPMREHRSSGLMITLWAPGAQSPPTDDCCSLCWKYFYIKQIGGGGWVGFLVILIEIKNSPIIFWCPVPTLLLRCPLRKGIYWQTFCKNSHLKELFTLRGIFSSWQLFLNTCIKQLMQTKRIDRSFINFWGFNSNGIVFIIKHI